MEKKNIQGVIDSENTPSQKTTLRSPLRYPGGKSRVAKNLLAFQPEHSEYREVFAGGASVFFQKDKAKINWINDKHPGLYAFYKALRDNFYEFSELCRAQPKNLKKTFAKWADNTDLMRSRSKDSIVERAMQFFFINRTVWGGRVVYDPARKSRLYFSNPDGWNNLEKRLIQLSSVSEKLQGVKISRNNFEVCLRDLDESVFIYCDPPYIRDTQCPSTDKLYDITFNESHHETLAKLLRNTSAKVMVSYDDCPEAWALYNYPGWRIERLEWTYSGRYAVTNEQKSNGVKEKKIAGQELLIMNY